MNTLPISSGTKQSLLTSLRSKATARQASAAAGLALAGPELPSEGWSSPTGLGEVSAAARNGGETPREPAAGPAALQRFPLVPTFGVAWSYLAQFGVLWS